jgi:hypothetical protein
MSYVVEEESGTFDRLVRQHNGYYAGDFWSTPTADRPEHLPREPSRPLAASALH